MRNIREIALAAGVAGGGLGVEATALAEERSGDTPSQVPRELRANEGERTVLIETKIGHGLVIAMYGLARDIMDAYKKFPNREDARIKVALFGPEIDAKANKLKKADYETIKKMLVDALLREAKGEGVPLDVTFESTPTPDHFIAQWRIE